MNRIKFHLYKIKFGQLESYSIGDANTILNSISGKYTGTQQFELFTIDSKGAERSCYEGTSMAIETYIVSIVLRVENIVAEREKKFEKIKKVTDAVFGVDENIKGD